MGERRKVSEITRTALMTHISHTWRLGLERGTEPALLSQKINTSEPCDQKMTANDPGAWAGSLQIPTVPLRSATVSDVWISRKADPSYMLARSILLVTRAQPTASTSSVLEA